MKQLSTKCKIICAIIILIIFIGVAIVVTKGFNFDIRNQSSQKIELYIGKKFEIEDVKQITNEVFEKEAVSIQKVEVYENQIAITAKEITDEQKAQIVNKVNEKYETELKAEDISIKNIPHTKFRAIVKPYIVPLIISTVLILVYTGIRFYKLGVIKTLLKVGGVVVITELVLFALMAITRFPIGRYTLPLVLFVYVLSMLGITMNLEKLLRDKKIEEQQ